MRNADLPDHATQSPLTVASSVAADVIYLLQRSLLSLSFTVLPLGAVSATWKFEFSIGGRSTVAGC